MAYLLLKVYAKCIDGQDQAARRRIEAAPTTKKPEPAAPDERAPAVE